VLRLPAIVLVLAVMSGPALACMGPTVIFQDNFQTANPAWDTSPSGIPITTSVPILSIAGGQAKLTPPPGAFAVAVYDSQFFPSSKFPSFDACVDITSPSVADPSQAAAGIVFGETAGPGFFVFAMEEDGQVAVAQLQQQPYGWSYLVPWQAAVNLKTGANASNTLRVTIGPAGGTATGNSGTAYVNGVKIATLALPSIQGAKLGLWGEGDPGMNSVSGATWTFSNLKITNLTSP
jgi:hypothetical protein